MGDTKETLAYQELEETVKRNKPQQIQHYGFSLKDIQDRGNDKEIPSTCSPFARDPNPVTYYYLKLKLYQVMLLSGVLVFLHMLSNMVLLHILKLRLIILMI